MVRKMDICVDLSIQDASVENSIGSLRCIQNYMYEQIVGFIMTLAHVCYVLCSFCPSSPSLTLRPYTSPLDTEGWLVCERGKCMKIV